MCRYGKIEDRCEYDELYRRKIVPTNLVPTNPSEYYKKPSAKRPWYTHMFEKKHGRKCNWRDKDDVIEYRRILKQVPGYKAKRKAYQKKRRSTPEYKAKQKARRLTPEFKAKQRAYQSTPEYKAYQKKYNSAPKIKTKQRAYQSTPEYKAKAKMHQKKYRSTPEYKAKQKAYRSTSEYKARRKARRSTPEYKAKRKACYHKHKNDLHHI